MCFTLCEFLLIVGFVTEPTYVAISVVSNVKCRPQITVHTPSQVVLKPIYAYQNLVGEKLVISRVGLGLARVGLALLAISWAGLGHSKPMACGPNFGPGFGLTQS